MSQTSVQIVSRPGHPDFLDLPWDQPLEAWTDRRLVEMARGISRHVVRFVEYGDRIYALKETQPDLAEHEYRLLRELRGRGLPVVEPVAVVRDRTDPAGELLGAVLVTRFLDYALPYRYLLNGGTSTALRAALLDAMAVLLVRLHLEGFFWGDCSLSNTLFRRDAGALMAYLVDAETGELRPGRLTDGQRNHDIENARENIAGGIYDLMARGRLPEDTDPLEVIDAGEARYRDLWTEITAAEEFDIEERWRLEERLARLNELGFDVEELVVTRTSGGRRLRIQPAVVEEGHHTRRLQRLTGLEVQRNQARRLLNDIECFGAWIERETGSRPPEGVVAGRWLTEVFEPAIAAVPSVMADRREPPELFHEILEHRWFLSEAAGREVETGDAVDSYVAEVLSRLPGERLVVEPTTTEVPVVRVDGAPRGPIDEV